MLRQLVKPVIPTKFSQGTYMNTYHTDLDTLDKGLENQLMLEAQVKYALATDHTHLIDVNDHVFEITVEGDEITLTELETAVDPKEEAIDLSITEVIDLIIRNSLLSTEPIRREQAETMLILANLKRVLAAD